MKASELQVGRQFYIPGGLLGWYKAIRREPGGMRYVDKQGRANVVANHEIVVLVPVDRECPILRKTEVKE